MWSEISLHRIITFGAETLRTALARRSKARRRVGGAIGRACPSPSAGSARFTLALTAVFFSVRSNPRVAADALLDQMNRLHRAHLVLALQKHAAQDVALRRDTRWADDFVRGIEAAPAPHRLSRSEVLAALEYQRVLSKLSTSAMDAKPTHRQLLAVALASGVPFVAFGFIDNGVMLASSEQIDSLLGARFGLTTLASAALGNIVADVFGVGVTQQIQNYAKRIPGAAPPRLSTLQQGMSSVKSA